MNDPREQAMFKRSRHKIFIISQDYYEVPKRAIRAKGNIYNIISPNSYRDVQNLYQDKSSLDMTPKEIKLSTNTCWDKKFSNSHHRIGKG